LGCFISTYILPCGAGFTLNGSLLYDSCDYSTAFSNFDTSEGFVPAITLFASERASINLGLNGDLQYYRYFQNTGYRPLCGYSSLQYNIPLWYSYFGSFRNLQELEQSGSSRLVSKQDSTSISVQVRDWDYNIPSHREVLRLNMGFVVKDSKVPTTPTFCPRPRVLSPVLQSPETLQNLMERSQFNPISFSVKFASGQVPSMVFLGWTTPSFRCIPEMFKKKEVCTSSLVGSSSSSAALITGQNLKVQKDAFQKEEVVQDMKTAYMVCLSDLLPEEQQQIRIPIRYVVFPSHRWQAGSLNLFKQKFFFFFFFFFFS